MMRLLGWRGRRGKAAQPQENGARASALPTQRPTPSQTNSTTASPGKIRGIRYITETMAPDETVLAVGRFPRAYDLISLLWLMSGVGIPVFVMRVVRKRSTELAVTSKRFVYKRGFVARRTDEFATNRIRHVQVTQTWLGRIFNYGRIHIEGSDIGAFGLPVIAKPIAFRRALSMSGNGGPEPSPVEQTEVAAHRFAGVV